MGFPTVITKPKRNYKAKRQNSPVYIPKSVLDYFNITEEEMWDSFDALARSHDCKSRGELIIKLAVGEVKVQPR